MALQITGRIKSIGATQSIASKNGGQPFTKREIILDTTRFDPYTGERDKYENYPMFEFGGEKCKDLDGYQAGQVVTISFDLQGSFFKGQDGVEKNFTRVRGYKIELRQVQTAQQQPVAQPAPQQPPMPSDCPPPSSNDGLPW